MHNKIGVYINFRDVLSLFWLAHMKNVSCSFRYLYFKLKSSAKINACYLQKVSSFVQVPAGLAKAHVLNMATKVIMQTNDATTNSYCHCVALTESILIDLSLTLAKVWKISSQKYQDINFFILRV